MRCDRCGARARYVATLTSDDELAFCGHHFEENSLALLAAGARVTELNGAPAPA